MRFSTRTRRGPTHLVRPPAVTTTGSRLAVQLVLPKIYNGRNKTFFFFNFEQFRETQNISGQTITVPTPAFRKGNFSAALTGKNLGTDVLGRAILENTIYDPLTQRTLLTGQVVRDPFPNNTIPLSQMDPVARLRSSVNSAADSQRPPHQQRRFPLPKPARHRRTGVQD